MFKRGDIYVGIVAILVGVGIILMAQGLVVRTSLDPAGPKAVPVALAWGMIGIGIIHIIGDLYARKKLPETTVTKSFNEWFIEYRPVMAIILICLAYAGLLDLLGYLIMTPVLIGGIMYVHGVRDIVKMLKVSVLVTVVLYVVFRYALMVKLPLGFFANF